MKTYHFIVKGDVQGVGYRFTIFLHATRLKITGTIKNLDNGDVEIYAQGTDNMISNLKHYLKIGSSSSHVTDISEDSLDENPYKRFDIIY
ncbi:MAG: acylphosphatase [Cetobacterium sp.]|uniref:acylphosphatase n=1 Tax=unclassified Cetobacterium TaxID=2630983 RepID=UPI00163C4D4E|nr:acylphosphatase [Cetobacterium sp. 2A]MBC2855664.1 acylphosphatase [Cetobacterium sp. 2A]